LTKSRHKKESASKEQRGRAKKGPHKGSKQKNTLNRTRTYTQEVPDPKSDVATNYTIRAQKNEKGKKECPCPERRPFGARGRESIEQRARPSKTCPEVGKKRQE
jgi:hypothetical protein